MSVDEMPMDALDLAIRREAAALRAAVEPSARTDAAWDDFLIARSATVVQMDEREPDARRWRMAAGLGLVAAVIATIVLVRDLRDDDLPKPPATTPPAVTTVTVTTTPTTTVPVAPGPGGSGYAALAFQRRSHLVAYPVGGGDPVEILGVPSTNENSTLGGNSPNPTYIDISSDGWAAETGVVSEGFWFFRLEDPAGTRRFVSLAGWPGGHQSRGSWNPEGTLYASVELGTTPVIIDPATGNITRLPDRGPSFNYPPTWTADGRGLLGGEMPIPCDPATLDLTTLSVIPTDGGQEPASVPPLYGEMNRILFGSHLPDESCMPPLDGTGWPSGSSDVVTIDRKGKTQWVAPGTFGDQSLLAVDFTSTDRGMWVLTDTADPGVLGLYLVDEQGRIELINTFDIGEQRGMTIRLRDVAPDDSSVIVAVTEPRSTRSFIVPTDGDPTYPASPAIEVDGLFAAYVPVSMIDTLRP